MEEAGEGGGLQVMSPHWMALGGDGKEAELGDPLEAPGLLLCPELSRSICKALGNMKGTTREKR